MDVGEALFALLPVFACVGLDSWCLDCRREASRAWRAKNRDECNERRRVPPSKLTCVECGDEFDGRRNRLLCSRRCKDRRYARLHPEAVREKQRRKDGRGRKVDPA